MRKREKGVFAHVVVGPEDDDCPLCKFEGTPAELQKLMRDNGGVVLKESPDEEGDDEPGHWEEQQLGRGIVAKKWVKKRDGC